MRLDKYLASNAIGTRKEVKGFIRKGEIRVNKQVCVAPEQHIDPETDEIYYKEKKLGNRGMVYYMFHKPKGCITARKDAVHKTVLDYFKKENSKDLFPVGRLDKDTTGLLLLTNDGDFDHALMSPKKHISKTYFFRAYGTMSEEERQMLEKGISIGADEPVTKPAKVEFLGVGEAVQNHRSIPAVFGRITITEGRYHQVKRMLKAIQCEIYELHRESIGTVMLDASLKPGEYRLLTKEEMQRLKSPLDVQGEVK